VGRLRVRTRVWAFRYISLICKYIFTEEIHTSHHTVVDVHTTQFVLYSVTSQMYTICISSPVSSQMYSLYTVHPVLSHWWAEPRREGDARIEDICLVSLAVSKGLYTHYVSVCGGGEGTCVRYDP